MSNEHVWPDWIKNLLPADMQKLVLRLHVRDSRVGHVRTFPQRIFDLTHKDVCDPCNTGWMSDWEGAVQPYIEGMLQGRGRALHATGQRRLAAWATLKCLMAVRSLPGSDIVPASHYREVYELRAECRPPDGFVVFTGKAGWSSGEAEAAYFRLNGIVANGPVDGDKVDGYAATYSVLDLVLQVFRLYEAADIDFAHGQRLATSLHRIWPDPDSFDWPPGPALTTAGLTFIGGEG